MKNIFKALANFQNECPVILKDTQGYGYVFADLPAILEVINLLFKFLIFFILSLFWSLSKEISFICNESTLL